MGKVIKLTETDLINLIKKTIEEATPAAAFARTINQTGNDRIANIASTMMSLKQKPIPTWVIDNPSNAMNGKTWDEYVRRFKLSKSDFDMAKALLTKMGQKSPFTPNVTAKPTQQTTGGANINKTGVPGANKPSAQPTGGPNLGPSPTKSL